jgi:hypothetical protein
MRFTLAVLALAIFAVTAARAATFVATRGAKT